MRGLFNKPVETPNKLWLLNLHIGRGTNSEMPAVLVGAYVAVFVAATDHESAAKEAVSQIRQRGYEFLDISDRKIHQLDPLKWSTYVKEAWPEFPSHFPTQKQVLVGIAEGKTFFGPFAGYERQSAQQGIQADGLRPPRNFKR